MTTEPITEKKKRPGRPRTINKMVTRNIVMSEEYANAVLDQNDESFSVTIRKLLEKYKDRSPADLMIPNKADYDAQFVDSSIRHVVFDKESHELAAHLGQGNVNQGVRAVIRLLMNDSKAAR